MVDNFRKIEKLIDLDNYPNSFMKLTIVSRNKDFTNGNNDNFFTYYLITSLKHFLAVEDEVKWLCEKHNARAYINLSIKSMHRLQSELAVELVKRISDNVTINPLKEINSLSGSLGSIVKRWIVDVDKDDLNKYDEIKSFVQELLKETGNDNGIFEEIHTKSGMHIITSPFNIKKFTDRFPSIDVHKNSGGTLLYAK